MSQTQTPDDLYKLLKKYEERIDRLERANTTPQSSPLIFQGEGIPPDTRIRRTDAGIVIVEKLTDVAGVPTWVKVWGSDTKYPGQQSLDHYITPITPFWSGGAYGGISAISSEQEVVSASGQSSRIQLPASPPGGAHWEVILRLMMSADSNNWTPIYAGIHARDLGGTIRAQYQTRSTSNKLASPNAPNGDYNWQTLTVVARFGIPPGESGWYVMPVCQTLGSNSGVYNRDYPHSDFFAKRVF